MGPTQGWCTGTFDMQLLPTARSMAPIEGSGATSSRGAVSCMGLWRRGRVGMVAEHQRRVWYSVFDDLLLGLGHWVQGFQCFPWLAVNFFLKDGLNVDSSKLQILLDSANRPMVGKPLYGLVSD
ncbi:putative folate-biopterin transporter [Arachis hypogaea]|nr:putative folate-biopterin transporter [Arachis hypogaea]